MLINSQTKRPRYFNNSGNFLAHQSFASLTLQRNLIQLLPATHHSCDVDCFATNSFTSAYPLFFAR